MFKCTQDYILVKPLERQQSKILDVISHEKYSRGLVVAVGPGERLKRNGEETGHVRPMMVKPGDWVTLETVAHYPVYIENGVTYRIHQEKDVAFISDRAFVDAHHSLSDAEVDALIAAHNQPLQLDRNHEFSEKFGRNLPADFLASHH